MRAEEMAVLSRELDDAREQLRRDDARLDQLSTACALAEQMAAPINQAFSPNHHLQANRRILWLCLCDEISQVNAARARHRSVINDLADQLTDEGIPV